MIPVNEPIISAEGRANVLEALESGWISSAGKFVNEFEQKFANYIGVKHGISVTSGTTALHTAVAALGLGHGDEVIVPAFTMAASYLAVLYIGAKPIFVDCELETYNIDIDQIENKITAKTKAIIPVHIYGHPVNMDKLLGISQRYNLFVIEDAAEAHGAKYKGKKCGSFGNFGCFSFYGNKIITTGEGGMVVTNDDYLAEEARRMKDFYFSKEKRFIHEKIGFNYRMTNLQAALGCGNLLHVEEYIFKKQHMANLYAHLLAKIPGLTLPKTKSEVTNVYWMYAVLVDPNKFGISKDELRIKLKRKGIDTRDFFYPPKDQPILKNYLNKEDSFPNTEFIAERGLYLPSGLAITDKQIKAVADAIKDIYIEIKH